MAQLTRSDIVEQIAKDTKRTAKDINEVLVALSRNVEQNLAAGNDVALTGFVSFKRVERKEREGRNPATGESLTIPAGIGLKVEASGKLKNAAKGS